MADPRTFTLIGEFKDGITPELAKINDQLAKLKANFAGVGSRKNTGFRGATNDIGKLVSAHKNLTSSIKEVDGALRSTLGTLKQYRSEMGKAASATRAFQKAGGNLGGGQFKKDMDAANKSAQAYLRTLQQINSQSRRMPRGGMGGGLQPPRPPRGGGGGMRPPSSRRGGGAGAGPGGFHMAEFGFAYTLGNALSQPIQNAIVQGFQIGVGLMTKPFEYFANRLGERMQDEMSDLKAAGGFFSMAQRQKDPFVKNFADAIQFTQENNKVMARLAASLPGKTQDYIEVAKRISDSVARTVLQDRAGTIKMAEQIRAGDVRTYGAKSITEMTGSEQTKKTIQVLLGDLTKDTVLAGMGGRTGAGGAMGAYGLPQLSERMISQDEVSMGQMQRYSAIFSDPMIMDALQRNINKINATTKNSADRLKAIAAMYKEIVTPELVERYRRTLAGVAETFNTAIFGEETGLFGLGRKMEGLGIKFNEYGQMLDKTGKVTTDITQAARENLAIYDLFRDILVNVGQVLAPIVENLSMIYDPLKQLGIDLNKAREVTYRVLQSFNQYRKGFENFGKQFKGKDKEKFDATRDLRAALLTIGNVMADFKVIGESDFTSLLNKLKDPNANIAQILQNMVDQFMKSDVAAKIGEFVGTIVGTVLSEVAKVTGFFSKRIASSNKLFEGLKKGFEAAGGTEAFKNIFKDVIVMIRDALLLIIPLIPVEAYMLAAAMVVLPAAVQGLGMAIASGITAGLGLLKNKISAMLFKTIAGSKVTGAVNAGAATAGAGGLGGLASGFMVGGRKSARMRAANIARIRKQNQMKVGLQRKVGASSYTSPIGPLPSAFAKGPGGPVMASRLKGLPKALKGILAFGKQALPFAKKLPGLSIALGALDFGLRRAAGQGMGEAVGGAIGAGAGGVVGGVLGSALGPGGTVAGGILGSVIGDWLGSSIGKILQDLPNRLSASWEGLKVWVANLPMTVGYAIGQARAQLEMAWSGLQKWWDSLGPAFSTMMVRVGASIKGKWTMFLNTLKAIFTGQFDWGGLARTLASGIWNAIKGAFSNITKWFGDFGRGMEAGYRETKGGYQSTETQQRQQQTSDWMTRAVTGKPLWKGSLGDAVSSEMKHKPPGSDLVIANSSETVIPAAGGHGMADFVAVLRSGFATMVSVYRQAQQKQDLTLGAINQTLISNQQQTNTRLSKLETKFSTPSIGGLGGGSIGGGIDAITPIAQQFGLQMTSGYRPGDPGYHGANRARDFSNGTGPTPQMMQFAQQLAASYGSSLKELIYTPLGFSIKNGQIVPPYAQGSHYNHVHVAYALGSGNPAFFSNKKDAVSWEKKHLGAGVGSLTTNTAELSNLMAQVYYGMGMPKKKAPGGGAANWMKLIDDDYTKNVKDKPWPGGPTRNSGRGGLDMWEGPGSAYLSPNGMYQQGRSSMAAAPINVTSPITINTQPGQDAEEIASIVAMKIGDAVAQARASSVFV